MPADHAGLPIPLADLRRAFHVDGSFRDIVVLGTDVADWERAYEYVRGLASSGIAGLVTEPDPFPSAVRDIFALREESGARLELHLNRIQLYCFFFGEHEIEFDLDPRELKSDAAIESVVSFMRGLGRAVGRPVHVTEENLHDQRWLTFDPTSDRWTFEAGLLDHEAN